ncbi:DUF922 domain-containing protein [Sphingomonas arantia]|uniref:DUF922 domain-containing protein n=1 Tax=Sphingomonas arantia TaxID=1460676 RepID=A0ABW4TT81_9SPHN
MSALAIFAALAAAAAPPSDAPIGQFAAIPNVTLTFYDVTGRDPAAIRRSIDAARPTDPNDGARVDGLSAYRYAWQWVSEQGVCRIMPDDIQFAATIMIPRLTTNVSPELRAEFDLYIRTLLAHEYGHVGFGWAQRVEIAAAINAADCNTANVAARAAVTAIGIQNAAYDAETGHGANVIHPFGYARNARWTTDMRRASRLEM